MCGIARGMGSRFHECPSLHHCIMWFPKVNLRHCMFRRLMFHRFPHRMFTALTHCLMFHGLSAMFHSFSSFMRFINRVDITQAHPSSNLAIGIEINMEEWDGFP